MVVVKSLELSNIFEFESNGGFIFGHFCAVVIIFSCKLPNKALFGVLRFCTNLLLLELRKIFGVLLSRKIAWFGKTANIMFNKSMLTGQIELKS